MRHPTVWHPAILLATWFGAGLLPKAPGTWGSLAATAWGILILWLTGPLVLAVGIGVVFVVGWWASGVAARTWRIHDPEPVVIDEVAGQWLTLLVVAHAPDLYLVAFVVFRGFDILKPWPAGLIDRKVGGGLGIMLDDVVAGIYAAAMMVGICWLTGEVPCWPMM